MKNLQNTLSELRRNKLVWNLLLIVLIILAMAVIAHFVMQAGTRHGARRTVPDFSASHSGEAQRIARANDCGCTSTIRSSFRPTRAARCSINCPKEAWR